MTNEDKSLYSLLRKKYIQLYGEVRKQGYPYDHGFLVTKIKFQEYVIQLMTKNTYHAKKITGAYLDLKNDKKLQEHALKEYQVSTQYESFFHGVSRS